MPKNRSKPLPQIRRVALWGNFGTLNLGNEATLGAMLYNLRRRLPQLDLFCICSEPSDTEARHRVRAVPMRADAAAPRAKPLAKPLRLLRRLGIECRAWIRAFALMRHVNALMIVGTGIMTDGDEGILGFPYELFKWSLAARLCGGQVLFVSVGVEAMSRPLTRMFLKVAFYLADYRSCRDANSRHLLQAVGFPGDDNRVYPDVAFSLPPGPSSALTIAGNKRKVVAIGIYNYRNRGSSSGDAAAAYRTYINRICSFTSWLLRRGYSVRVIIGDYAYDRMVVADLRAALQARGEALEPEFYADEPANSYEELMAQIDSAEFVVASRFHNVLLSLMLSKPVLSVSYDAKNEELMNQVGLAEFCQPLNTLDVEHLADQFCDLEQRAPVLRSSIQRKTSQFRDSLEEQYELIERAAS